MDALKRLKLARVDVCRTCHWKNFGEGRQHEGRDAGTNADTWSRCCYAVRKLPFEQAVLHKDAFELSSEVYGGPASRCPLGKWGDEPIPEAVATEQQRQTRIRHQRGGLKRVLAGVLAGADPQAAAASLLEMVRRGELEPEIRAEIVTELEGGDKTSKRLND